MISDRWANYVIDEMLGQGSRLREKTPQSKLENIRPNSHIELLLFCAGGQD